MINTWLKLKYTLRVFMLISLPLFLTACSNSSGVWSNDVAGNAAQNNTDISVGFLGQIFGTVGSVTQGNNNQLLGQLFYQFNLGVMMVVGAFLIYTILISALRGANEGSFQGQGKNVAYYFLKIALGVGMVIPSATTGYCMAQRLMMDVTVAGVHVADNIWNTALNYLDDGHAVWVDPTSNDNKTSSMINTDTFNAFMGNPDEGADTPLASQLGYNVLNSEVCMLKAGKTPNPTMFMGKVDGVYVSEYQFSDGSSDAGCGSIDWSEANKLKDVTHDGTTGSLCVAENLSAEVHQDADPYTSMYCQQAQTAVSGVIADMVPAAYKYYCAQGSNAEDSSVCAGYMNQTDDIPTDIYHADVNYTNNIYAAYDHMNNTGGDFSQAKKDGEQDGWMMAGRYYWDLAAKDAAVADLGKIGQYYFSKDSNGITAGPSSFSSSVNDYFTAARTDAVNYANAVDGTNSSSTDVSSTTSALNSSGSDWKSSLGKYLSPGLAKLLDAFSEVDSFSNPIEWLTQLGQDCIQTAGSIFVAFVTGFTLAAGFAGIMTMCSSTYLVEQELSSWVKPLIISVIAMLLMPGFILGYYCPLYPFMVFTFGVIAWFIFVIEAMAAAPLVALGLTHPDGHDFLGKAEQAIMLALGVFLRPALMVIGLIAGMILSFVAFKIIDYTFSNFMQDLFQHNNVAATTHDNGNILYAAGIAEGASFVSGGNLFTLIFAIPAMLIIFATIVMEVTHQCYGLIYQLPDYIMRWIGAPNASSPVQIDKMTGAVQGSVSSLSKGMGDGASSGISADQSERAEKKKNTQAIIAARNKNKEE